MPCDVMKCTAAAGEYLGEGEEIRPKMTDEEFSAQNKQAPLPLVDVRPTSERGTGRSCRAARRRRRRRVRPWVHTHTHTTHTHTHIHINPSGPARDARRHRTRSTADDGWPMCVRGSETELCVRATNAPLPRGAAQPRQRRVRPAPRARVLRPMLPPASPPMGGDDRDLTVTLDYGDTV